MLELDFSFLVLDSLLYCLLQQGNKIRGWLERHMGVHMLDADKPTRQYIGPLGLLEQNTLLFKDPFIGV